MANDFEPAVKVMTEVAASTVDVVCEAMKSASNIILPAVNNVAHDIGEYLKGKPSEEKTDDEKKDVVADVVVAEEHTDSETPK